MQTTRPSVLNKLDGYRRRLAHECQMWYRRRSGSKYAQKYDKWIAGLRNHPPDVLIGTNFSSGGVRQHILAIKQYSSLRLELVPPNELLEDFDGNLSQLLSEFVPDVRAVHSHVLPWFIEWCGKRQKSGVRWSHTYHLNYFPEHAKGELLPWQKEINDALLNVARHADVRISVARWQREYLLKTHGIETLYIPNGVDVALCDKADAKRFRQKVGDGPFVLYVGRNDPVKNPADFVRLAQQLPRQSFVMMGHDLSREILRDEWELEAPGNLNLPGPASHTEVQDAIAACSALVVTSKREGLPTLVLEAMAQLKPVVVPNEAGCTEAIGDGEFGFIYRQGDIDDLAEKTLAALADTKRCAGARKRVLSEYDWRVVAPKLDALYLGDVPCSK
jgi:glycosyltransferase involved in cell wall biosynthesis